MRSLLDVNVVIALLDSKHDFHEKAQSWWSSNDNLEWATCPIIQNGVLRIMMNPAYHPPNSFSLEIVADLIRDLLPLADHEFWSDDISLLDTRRFDLGQVAGAKQLTDMYLLALAVKNGGRFVSFDSRVISQTVQHAKPENFMIL